MKKRSDQLILSATDLGNFLGCRHRSDLDKGVALGGLEKVHRESPVLEDLKVRGLEHEKAYLAYLDDQGLFISLLDGSNPTESMKQGYDVIYQARLGRDQWSGIADFLIKVDKPSKLGDWSYEVLDTKLSFATKAQTILQLSLYSDLLQELQGCLPEKMYVVNPQTIEKPLAYRVDDFLSLIHI